VVPEPSTSLPPAGPADLLGLLVESAPDGVLSVDERGVVQTFNAAAERMFGYSRDDVLGRDVRMLVPEPAARDAGSVAGYLPSPDARGTSARRTVAGLRKDGTTLAIDVTIIELAVAGERHFGMFIRDRGTVGRLEAQLHQSQRMEAMGRLAFGIAHHFNNLLTVIFGYSDTMLATLPQQHPFRSHVVEVRRAGEETATLTRQLLAFSRRQQLSPRLLDLNEVVLNLESMLRRLLGEDVTIRHVLAPDPPVITADLAQLEQVIVTLAVTARDAMPTGGQLTFATRVVTVDDGQSHAEGVRPGRFALLTVSDTGVGIPADMVGHVFEPFFTTTAASAAGALGLATAHGVVAQSGGHLTVTSEMGSGSTFRVYLPAAAERPSPDTSRGRPRSSTERPVARGTETILVVEDDVSLRRLTALYLQTAGYVVRTAGLGLDALGEADTAAGPIDLLVTDMVLPDMSGQELAARLRTRNAALGVLFISGYPEAALQRYGLDGAGQHFLQKPFAPSALGQAVRALLQSADTST
jgi:two-component system, cell cycle sensor histidine kinase and response regulator CckA